MEEVDWLADMLDELRGFAVQERDNEMLSSIDRIRQIYEYELQERTPLKRIVEYIQ